MQSTQRAHRNVRCPRTTEQQMTTPLLAITAGALTLHTAWAVNKYGLHSALEKSLMVALVSISL